MQRQGGRVDGGGVGGAADRTDGRSAAGRKGKGGGWRGWGMGGQLTAHMDTAQQDAKARGVGGGGRRPCRGCSLAL